MSINLTYGDDADAQDIDHAILTALGTKTGYVIELQHIGNGGRPVVEDVVIADPFHGGSLFVRRFDEAAESAVGPMYAVDAVGIVAIKVY